MKEYERIQGRAREQRPFNVGLNGRWTLSLSLSHKKRFGSLYLDDSVVILASALRIGHVPRHATQEGENKWVSLSCHVHIEKLCDNLIYFQEWIPEVIIPHVNGIKESLLLYHSKRWNTVTLLCKQWNMDSNSLLFTLPVYCFYCFSF